MTKTAREWFEELPSPTREMAIDEAIKANRHELNCHSLDQTILVAFNWDDSTQGFYYWQHVYKALASLNKSQMPIIPAKANVKFVTSNCKVAWLTEEPRPQKHVPHRHKYSPIKFN